MDEKTQTKWMSYMDEKLGMFPTLSCGFHNFIATSFQLCQECDLVSFN
jgi:hypothetical protein